MITRTEYIDSDHRDIYFYHIVKYLLFGFIPIYIKKIRLMR